MPCLPASTYAHPPSPSSSLPRARVDAYYLSGPHGCSMALLSSSRSQRPTPTVLLAYAHLVLFPRTPFPSLPTTKVNCDSSVESQLKCHF